MEKNICIYISKSLCCTAEVNNIVNQLYFNQIIFFKEGFDHQHAFQEGGKVSRAVFFLNCGKTYVIQNLPS